MRQHMLVLLALWLGQFGSAELEAGGDSFVQEASQLMHVQKCCPQAQMMVEVASANGPKFLCQVQNDSFNWAPDYLDTQDILHSFGNKTDAKNTTLLHSQLSQESHLCAADNGPCLLPITGKPQCGPVFQFIHLLLLLYLFKTAVTLLPSAIYSVQPANIFIYQHLN